MVTLHEVITFLVSMQISISSLQTHNVNRCGRSRHLARKLSLRRKRSSPNVFEMARSEERRVGKECRFRWWPYHYKKKKRRVAPTTATFMYFDFVILNFDAFHLIVETVFKAFRVAYSMQLMACNSSRPFFPFKITKK